jgi:hypothetical protein
MVAALRSTHDKPLIHGLLEVDVSRPRTIQRGYKAKIDESLSFTAFLIACVAKAVDERKAVQAFRQGSKRLILFDDVDVLTAMLCRSLSPERHSWGTNGICLLLVTAQELPSPDAVITLCRLHRAVRGICDGGIIAFLCLEDFLCAAWPPCVLWEQSQREQY